METQAQETAAVWFAETTLDLTGKLISVLEERCESLAEVPVEMVRALFKTALGNALEEIILLPATTRGLGQELACTLKQRHGVEAVDEKTNDDAPTAAKKGRKPRKNMTNKQSSTLQMDDPSQADFNNVLLSGEPQAAGIVVKQSADTYPM